MSKIDWTKPIETITGRPATLLHVLNYPYDQYVIIIDREDGKEILTRCNEAGHTVFTSESIIRNVVSSLRIYGSPAGNNVWSEIKYPQDTHIIELTPEDLKRMMRPLSAQEYHGVSDSKIIIRSIAARGTLSVDALAELIVETNGAYYSVIKNRYGMPMENQPILELGQFLSHWHSLDQQRDGA